MPLALTGPVRMDDHRDGVQRTGRKEGSDELHHEAQFPNRHHPHGRQAHVEDVALLLVNPVVRLPLHLCIEPRKQRGKDGLLQSDGPDLEVLLHKLRHDLPRLGVPQGETPSRAKSSHGTAPPTSSRCHHASESAHAWT